jgi:hypothetical protein
MTDRIVSLPSGKQTIMSDGPNGPVFPYANELTDPRDQQYITTWQSTGSRDVAQQNSPAWAGAAQPNIGGGPMAYVNQQGVNVNQLESNNTAELQRLQAEQERIFKQQNNLGVQNQNFATAGLGNAQTLNQMNNQGIGQSWQSTNQANAEDQQSLGQYTGALQAAGQWDMQNYGNLAGAYANTGILKAGGYGADVVSQAQYAQADPGAIAAQNQALGQLQGAANGSLNQTSKAAQAYANSGDIANQRMAADKLQAIAGGSKDVHVGQEDPAAYASARDALQHFTDLSNPQITAQEKFIYEQARLRQEQDDRANRGATMANLRQRGVSGSGMELTDTALGAQRTSQNRLLSDLGAQSNAVGRAMTALQGQAGLSSQLNSQANALASSNADRQTQAQAMASQAYSTLRAQGFSEEYARGQAADIMATANADRQLGAMTASGNLASTQRSQSFNEDFSRKSAADSMGQFNKEQSQISQRWQEQYAAGQQTDAWNRATDLNDAANTVGRNFAQDQGNLFTGRTGVTAATNNRNQQSVQTAGQLNANSTAGWQNAFNTGIAANGQQSGTYAQQLAAMTQLGQTGMQNNTNITNLKNQNLQSGLGVMQGQQATDFAKQQYEASKSNGLFGTPILSQEGILGIKGIPLL